MSHVHAHTNRRWSAEVSFPDEDHRQEFPLPRDTGVLAVLIRVPTVRPARHSPRPTPKAAARVRVGSSARPRRRLRRGVRLAAWVLLSAAPAALAVTRLLGAVAVSGGGVDEAQADLAAFGPPSIRLSVEAADSERAAPVILPGYVLPDDGTGDEEPAHAGG